MIGGVVERSDMEDIDEKRDDGFNDSRMVSRMEFSRNCLSCRWNTSMYMYYGGDITLERLREIRDEIRQKRIDSATKQ